MGFARKAYALSIPLNGELWGRNGSRNHEGYRVIEGELSWVLISTNHNAQALAVDNRTVSR